MASLRFNYDGEKRPERGRPVNYEIMTRNGRFINTGTFPIPPRPLPSKPLAEVATAPQSSDADITQSTEPEAVVLPLEVSVVTPTTPLEVPIAEPLLPQQEQVEQSAEIPPELTLSDSDRFIARLENYENGVVKIRQQVDVTKVLFDEILIHMDSFLKIMDVIRENEERKQREPQVSAATQKTSKDTIDEVLDLLQTPTFQSILRQVLMGILVKK